MRIQPIAGAGRRTFSTVLCILAVSLCAGAHAQLRYSGSDSVEPMVEAAQGSFARSHSGFKLQIKSTGTSVGFRDLCTGKATLIGASRQIKPDESALCTAAGIQVSEVPVAMDAVALVVSVKNTWLKDLTMSEVHTLFAPSSAGKLTSWKQVRPSFPDQPLRTAGPNVKHGTFGFFSESLGLKGFIRADYKDFAQHVETGRYVAADPGAIGFIPSGEMRALDDQIRPIGINFGNNVVMPGLEEVANGKYERLSRILYIYVNQGLLEKSNPQDIEFARFLIRDAEKFVQFANLIPLRAQDYRDNLKRVSFRR